MGRGTVESGLFRSERYQLEQRTSDPANHSEGEAWIRTDVSPDTGQIATLRFDNGGSAIDIPIFDSTASADSDISKAWRVRVNGTTGFISVIETGGTYDQLRLQHNGNSYGVHDSLSAPLDSGVLLYMIGASNDSVYEYDVSTAFDVSTASFSQSFDVSGQDGFPEGMVWEISGSKVYIVGSSSDSVYEYDVSTAFDVSTASFSQSFDVSGQTGSPKDLSWDDDGSKLYVVGDGAVEIYEYDVSTAFDVSTASFSQSFDVSGQGSGPTGLAWNDTGSKLYTVDVGNESVYEYDVSTAFDVSTASFSQSFDVSGNITSPQGIVYNDTGSRFYIPGSFKETVFEYDVSTAFDVSTASFSQSFDVSGQDGIPFGVSWNGAPQYK